MTTEASNENVNLLLTKLMTEKYCKQEASDYDACVQNFVPQKVDGSHVDASLQRMGLAKCEPYRELAHKCLSNDKYQQNILRTASRAPTCKDERIALSKCQHANPNSSAACEKQALEVLMCGLVYMIQRQRGKGIETQ